MSSLPWNGSLSLENGVPVLSVVGVPWNSDMPPVQAELRPVQAELRIERHQFRALLMAITCSGGNIGTRVGAQIVDAIARECGL